MVKNFIGILGLSLPGVVGVITPILVLPILQMVLEIEQVKKYIFFITAFTLVGTLSEFSFTTMASRMQSNGQDGFGELVVTRTVLYVILGSIFSIYMLAMGYFPLGYTLFYLFLLTSFLAGEYFYAQWYQIAKSNTLIPGLSRSISRVVFLLYVLFFSTDINFDVESVLLVFSLLNLMSGVLVYVFLLKVSFYNCAQGYCSLKFVKSGLANGWKVFFAQSLPLLYSQMPLLLFVGFVEDSRYVLFAILARLLGAVTSFQLIISRFFLPLISRADKAGGQYVPFMLVMSVGSVVILYLLAPYGGAYFFPDAPGEFIFSFKVMLPSIIISSLISIVHNKYYLSVGLDSQYLHMSIVSSIACAAVVSILLVVDGIDSGFIILVSRSVLAVGVLYMWIKSRG